MKRDEAILWRSNIERAASLIPDVDAVKAPGLFPAWAAERNGKPIRYLKDERVRYGADLYRCLSEHKSQAGWTPTAAPSLWAKVLIPDPAKTPAWEQPASTNGYHKGDRVLHRGNVWVSDLNNNVWEPGVYGWKVVK